MRPKGAIELVIFDCDGVLIDTEPVANVVLQQRLEAAGLAMPYEEVMRTFVGRSKADCLTIAAQRLGRPLPARFGEDWDRAFDAALRKGTRTIDGVDGLLRDFPLPYCVASNGEPERMRLALESAGLLPLVDGRLFTASEVAHPKPAPDLFLHAARTMGAPPAATVVVEDTVTGVTAAAAVFDDMRELPALLGLR